MTTSASTWTILKPVISLQTFFSSITGLKTCVIFAFILGFFVGMTIIDSNPITYDYESTIIAIPRKVKGNAPASSVFIPTATPSVATIVSPEQSCPELSGNILKLYEKLTATSGIIPDNERENLSLSDLAVVTFTSADHLTEAIRSCDSFQKHPQLKKTAFVMYFAEDVPESSRQIYKTLCPVAKIESYHVPGLPDYAKDLQQYRFKAIYQAMALQKYKFILNIDASMRFLVNSDLKGMINKLIKNNTLDVTLLTKTGHSMFATTHPTMYNCYPTIDPNKMKAMIQFQSGAILWVGTSTGWKVMKRFVKCALQPNCMAPPGAGKRCNFDQLYKNKGKFSGCHRYDQAAINMILYDESMGRPQIFQQNQNVFNIQRNARI